MTRINCVPVECLTNTHLLAEYKEITRPFNKVIKRIEAGTMGDVVIPEKYCLGKGHETFFFNKLNWLWWRYYELFSELMRRGVNVDGAKFNELHELFIVELGNGDSWGNWHPTPEDMYLNMARLAKRSKLDNVLEELGS